MGDVWGEEEGFWRLICVQQIKQKTTTNTHNTELRQTMLMIEVKHFDSLTQLSVKHLRKRKIGLKKKISNQVQNRSLKGMD